MLYFLHIVFTLRVKDTSDVPLLFAKGYVLPLSPPHLLAPSRLLLLPLSVAGGRAFLSSSFRLHLFLPALGSPPSRVCSPVPGVLTLAGPHFSPAKIEISSRYLVLSHCGLNLCFCDSEHYLMCLLPSCVSSFLNRLFRSFTY